MQGGKNWILPKEMNANRFFWDSYIWLEIWSNHLCPSLGPNGGSVAMDSVKKYFLPSRSNGMSSLSGHSLGLVWCYLLGFLSIARE
jgi:hypothetical protein